MSVLKHKPWVTEGPLNGTAAVIRAFDEEMAKALRLRELLTDTAMLALVKKVLQPTAAMSDSSHNSKHHGPRGAIAKATYQIVRDMGYEPFTKRDLADKLRSSGLEVKNAKNALFYPVQKMLIDGVIERIQHGGGRGTNTYRKIRSHQHQQPANRREGRNADVVSDTPNTAAIPQPQARGDMERIALDCIARITQPFAGYELINSMGAAGYTFAANADASIQSFLRNLVRQKALTISQEGNGQRPTLYRRRTAE